MIGIAMTRMLTFTNLCWSAVLVVAIGVSSYGCKDSASVSDAPQVPLASLAVTPGTLQPAFSSNTTNYTAEAPTAVTSVTVTAMPKDSTTTMTINGVSTAAGQGRAFSLGSPGSTTSISIVLSSQTGAESTYTVTVTRLLSSDNNLSALSVTPGTLSPTFDSNQLTYTVAVATNVAGVTVAATKSEPAAAMLIGSVPIPAGTASGQATIPLNGPGTATPIPVEVTAPNGSKKTYSITVNRAAPSSNNNLSALSVTPGTLSPAFDSSRLIYTVGVAFNITSVLVVATKADADAVISGDLPNEGRATIPLDGPGTSKNISIIVTAPNGSSKTYTITVNRAAPSTDSNLSNLTVSAGALNPSFAADTLNYSVDVAGTVDSITVSATKSDPNAVMSASGSVIAAAGTPTGQVTVPLGLGTSTPVTISITAQDGISTKAYTITVNRPPR